MEEGTGIVHLAPAYGEEDYRLSQEKGFPFVSNIDDSTKDNPASFIHKKYPFSYFVLTKRYSAQNLMTDVVK